MSNMRPDSDRIYRAYSIKEDRNDMATWNSRGLRGSTLEDMINKTNEKYRENGLALIQKIPTPITPIKMEAFI